MPTTGTAYSAKEVVSYQNNSGQIASATRTMQGDAEYDLTIPVVASTTNQEVDISFLRANLQSICITSTAACTITTNSATTPADTKTLPVNGFLSWNVLHTDAVPFSADVTKLFITSTLANTVVVSILTNL